MPTVHNLTDQPANFDYATPAGLNTGHIVGIPANGGNAVIGNIVHGGVHASFGFLHANANYPNQVPQPDIYIRSTDADPASITFG